MHTLMILLGLIATCAFLAGVIILGVALYQAPIAIETDDGLALGPVRQSQAGRTVPAAGLAVGVASSRIR